MTIKGKVFENSGDTEEGRPYYTNNKILKYKYVELNFWAHITYKAIASKVCLTYDFFLMLLFNDYFLKHLFHIHLIIYINF